MSQEDVNGSFFSHSVRCSWIPPALLYPSFKTFIFRSRDAKNKTRNVKPWKVGNAVKLCCSLRLRLKLMQRICTDSLNSRSSTYVMWINRNTILHKPVRATHDITCLSSPSFLSSLLISFLLAYLKKKNISKTLPCLSPHVCWSLCLSIEPFLSFYLSLSKASVYCRTEMTRCSPVPFSKWAKSVSLHLRATYFSFFHDLKAGFWVPIKTKQNWRIKGMDTFLYHCCLFNAMAWGGGEALATDKLAHFWCDVEGVNHFNHLEIKHTLSSSFCPKLICTTVSSKHFDWTSVMIHINSTYIQHYLSWDIA